MRSFLLRLLMVLQFQGIKFILGLVMLGMGVFGFLDFKPLPPDSAFEYPVPYQPLFCLIALFGAVWAVRAWRKTPK